MKTLTKHIVAKLTLASAVLILLAHSMLPHQHRTMVFDAKPLYKHPQTNNLVHFILDMLSADGGTDHLKNIQEVKGGMSHEFVSPTIALCFFVSELPMNSFRQSMQYESQHFYYSNHERGPPPFIV